ncbi:dTDP-4-dehydrorhamnose 3,5-epimerase family protein [Shewanella sp. cp20]|uniref:dTDP-4-dehydrorhamnose 3,5-epimerase family protein n=1 Tax=Shewanella sp. cp20 TaxID=1521167 RepID=UPI000AAC55B3
MKIHDTNIPDVKLLEPQVFGDERGCFFETFRKRWFKEHLVDLDFVQENQSHSLQGTIPVTPSMPVSSAINRAGSQVKASSTALRRRWTGI